MNVDATRARRAFVWACALDVATFKPGNVSVDAAGHGMQAALFVASADAAAPPLFDPSLGVGERIEAAMRQTLAVAGCNTNLGIVLLAAPLARAFELADPKAGPGALRARLREVLAALGVDDAKAAYRAIALTQPGGLGRAADQDVHDTPTMPLHEAMALAAGRDRIAAQYADGYAAVFMQALGVFGAALQAARARGAQPGAAVRQAMQRCFLDQLSRHPDSHIARQHGPQVAHTVMTQAGARLSRLAAGQDARDDRAWRAWDLELKSSQVNPGTTADLCAVTGMVAAWLDPGLPEVLLAPR